MSDTSPRQCAAAGFPKDAIDAAIYGAARGDDGHTDCYYAALLRAAFPHLLRNFLWSDETRDVTGKWGFTGTQGDEFRKELMSLVEDNHAAS
jgi:hypothetical protein